MAAPVAAKRQRTILVVEDDESARDALARVLVREGYLVLTAATGHDAIALVRTPLSPIDVVLLDVRLPDVSGADLCARLRELHPKLPVVVCTGAAEPGETAGLLKLGVRRCFLKPVVMEELLASVQEAVA